MSSPVVAAENDCDTLMGSIAKTGEVPAIIINPADETVKIVTSKGSCSESIEAWSNREPLSAASPPAAPAPAAEPTPVPTSQQAPKSVFTSPAPPVPAVPSVQGVPTGTATFTPDPFPEKPKPKPASKPARPPSPVIKAPPAGGGCDYRLQEVWEVQVFKIEGLEHYLARAFTVDLDNDRTVDNVSFTLIAKDGGQKIIHYFGLAGESSGRDYPALALPDDSLIGRICFGDLRYEKPKFFQDKALTRSLIEMEDPDLAGQKAARDRGIVYQPKTKKKKVEEKEEPISWLLWGSIGGLVLLAAGGGVFFIRRRKAAAKDDDEAEEDEKGDDQEDGEDGDKKTKKSKFSLGGLFKRKKKKAADDEDGDDGDDDDGDEEDEDGDKPKKKKSKFSLGGLFKRKKKKAADDDADDEDGDGAG